jgi:hypothetical protein
MRRILGATLVVVLAISIAFFAFAQEPWETNEPETLQQVWKALEKRHGRLRNDRFVLDTRPEQERLNDTEIKFVGDDYVVLQRVRAARMSTFTYSLKELRLEIVH